MQTCGLFKYISLVSYACPYTLVGDLLSLSLHQIVAHYQVYFFPFSSRVKSTHESLIKSLKNESARSAGQPSSKILGFTTNAKSCGVMNGVKYPLLMSNISHHVRIGPEKCRMLSPQTFLDN